MAKIKCVISYDGTNFSGFQIQPRNRTIQGELEKALTKIHKGPYIRIHPSGRTDTGVHAKGQVIHFETSYNLPVNNWKRALNTLLPSDVYVRKVKEVPDAFHSRYDVVEKEYRYYIWNELETDVFKQNYAYQFPYTLDIQAIKNACKRFEGSHNFTTFSSAKATTKGSKVRTMYEVTCNREGSQIELVFRGSGFLYNMVRIIAGTLLDIGQGKLLPSDVDDLLQKKDRRLVGETVPAQGLYLWEVRYE